MDGRQAHERQACLTLDTRRAIGSTALVQPPRRDTWQPGAAQGQQAPQRSVTELSRTDYVGALDDVSRLVSQPTEVRLANLERYTRCATVRFHRRPVCKEDADLQKLMPSRLSRNDDVWEYTSCAICLTDFADGEELRRASCAGGHAFHPKCLRGWLERSHATCPVCRGDTSRRKGVQPGRPAPEALAEYVIRRMRSGKVDLSVSSSNQSKAAKILRKMREPAAPVTEENEKEMEEEGMPPKLALPPTLHIANLLHEFDSSAAAQPPTAVGGTNATAGHEPRRHNKA